MKDLTPRILSGIVYIALIFFGTTGSPWLFAGLMLVFMLLCLFEFVRLTRLKDKLYQILAFAGSIGVFYYFSDFLLNRGNAFYLDTLSFAGPVLFLLACFTILFSTDELRTEFGKATIGIIYTAVPFSLALTLPQTIFDLGKEVITKEILFIFILIWVSDVMAYVFGSLWGKNKLAPKISSGKTWEGAIGGFAFTILMGYLLQYHFLEPGRINWLIAGLIVGVFAPLGDLVESKLKRYFDVKDSGKLLPGHGGFLDRLDSFLFVIPMIYLYLLLIKFL
ncbi:MAG: phosphatidate cytidylyltransferase [Weeksellaceae bacterium]